ncbi:MAG: nucleoside triphosphate pyrophosphohydrolase family protein [Vicingaceae bacterium]
MQKTIEAVKEFHDAFGIQVAHQPKARVEDRIIDLRYNLMKEENDEYLEAARSGDLVEIADALGDMLYILNGTIITHGLQEKIGPVFEEIQRSNMSKLDENGKPIYREDGKVLKSALYFKPNISRILGE